MQDCTETQSAPVDACVPQIQDCGGPLLVLHQVPQDLLVSVQPETLHGSCQVPLCPDEVVLENVWGTGIQDDLVQDYEGPL